MARPGRRPTRRPTSKLVDPHGSAADHADGGAGLRGGAGQHRGGPATRTSACSRSSRRHRRRSMRWSGCTRETEQWTELLESTSARSSWWRTRRSARRSTSASRYLYEEEVGDAGARPSTPTARFSTWRATTPQALRRLNSIYQQQEMWADLAETLLRELTLVTGVETPTGLIDLKFRLGGDPRVPTRRRRRGHRVLSRHSRAAAPTHEGAREALERRLASDDHPARGGARSSSRSTPS